MAAWFAKEQPREYAAIADWATDKAYPVTFMCDQLGVIRQGYYRWLATGPCERERTDAELTKTIREIHTELHAPPRRAAGLGRTRRARRPRRHQAGLAPDARRWPAWTPPTGVEEDDHRWAAARRRLGPDRAGLHRRGGNTRWCGDITYTQTVDGWVYTATVIDLHSRKVVGYAVADHLRTSLIVEALFAALFTRKPPKGVIFHSDRGCQYTSQEFADFCAESGVVRSMGRRATCYDNAVAESFFATYKKELIHTRPWNDLTEVRQHTFLWIEGYYNRRRRHSTLGYLTPDEYELGFRKLTDLAA